MKNRMLFIIIMAIWFGLIIISVGSILLIEGLSDYRFDAQLGMAIFIWGFIGSILLLILAGIHNLILYFMRK